MTVFGMISTAKSRAYTAHALRTFFATTPCNRDDLLVLLVNDGDYQLEFDLKSYPIQILKNRIPLSFALNGNILIAEALERGCDLVLLNNDLVFSPGWYQPVCQEDHSIVVPVSNNQFPHVIDRADGSRIEMKPRMELSDYLGHEADFSEIAAVHLLQEAPQLTTLNVLCAPFFAVRFPLAVLQAVGGFDPRYGIGGGEDYDYCLRVWLAGFNVKVARRSFILHFGGKSITTDQSQPEFINIFRQRWGDHLTRYVFDDAPDAQLLRDFSLGELQETGFKKFVMALLAASPGDIYYPPG